MYSGKRDWQALSRRAAQKNKMQIPRTRTLGGLDSCHLSHERQRLFWIPDEHGNGNECAPSAVAVGSVAHESRVYPGTMLSPELSGGRWQIDKCNGKNWTTAEYVGDWRRP
jgi:hypothetical protein